jgi:L,D-transpeptidase ErfK/SrfK
VRRSALFLIIFLLAVPEIHASGAFPLNNPSKIIIGAANSHIIREKETLVELARKYSIGYNEITAANSDIDPWVPEKGAKIVIPTVWLLPERMENGVLINLAEMRLYYFFNVEKNKYVKTFPIGIGSQGSNTPVGDFRITLKVKDPVWKVPESIREEDPELPEFVLPGPDNPLGGYWLHLSINSYGIHGTNKPLGIGRKVSHGCLRLYPEDIKVLYTFIKSGTPVRIVDKPVKTGFINGKVYIEVHGAERKKPELVSIAVKELSRKHLLTYVDTLNIISAIKKATGLPAVISK